ncbi:MAG TPA: GTP-binding protein [Burkholderiales bacterium]|jgi:sulfate adenylyltransferase subunit 1|nr:GTP-binding protein [Burkholderiales bacterium]
MSAIEHLNPVDTGMLRFTSAGSVDDGKSTLIGRLLYDTKAIFEDQLSSIERSTKKRGQEGIDLSLLTDGLLAEREQGITIDVAYRYFATPSRKFIIADTPGHEQYTRNMVTGASTADLAIVLVDARKGLLTQSRRHAYIASLLRIPHLVLAVNKMDLVDYAQEAFVRIRDEFQAFARDLGFHRIDALPISALNGDMVVQRGGRLGWHAGPTLLQLLETAEVGRSAARAGFYFPVQLVARPGDSGVEGARGYAGRIESGRVKEGDTVTVLPAGLRSRVREIRTWNGRLPSASAPQSVTLVLEDQIDVSRGDVLVSEGSGAAASREFEATVCWLSEEAFNRSRRYLVKHGARTVKAILNAPRYRVNVNTLAREPADTLALNDIGRVTFKTSQPLAYEAYGDNRAAGSFIVIDEASNDTVAAGLIA